MTLDLASGRVDDVADLLLVVRRCQEGGLVRQKTGPDDIGQAGLTPVDAFDQIAAGLFDVVGVVGLGHFRTSNSLAEGIGQCIAFTLGLKPVLSRD